MRCSELESHKIQCTRNKLLEMLHISRQEKEFRRMSYIQKEIPGRNRMLHLIHQRFRLDE